jgi:hypothetical protein
MNKLLHKTAFVIRFDTNSDIEGGIIEGKVEHVALTRQSDSAVWRSS